ncbi:hypothetical protein CLV24_14118 [Pontibacter ummariensis]|uniref:DUF4345 domain-containing protein n=1 Tax=Pontibacter ummariensis TaxID=1610492 RepID=A0A239LFW3_9BACT|nr:hypothetical protein [Pontibacter ummariensis]PRY03386.1 hypothetical protein CLV24_14118 [Pontibacter ummariensis]SNT29180.1 hypothetical protein SAMN06296052_1418 [Pontibacter ummariensis]
MRLSVSTVALLQGLFWLLTGVWPLVHLPSFIWVTGPKEDVWLLYTVSVLIISIGAVLTAAGLRKTVTAEIKWLGVLGAAGLIGIDLRYALADVIRDVYLLDAVVEAGIILLWLLAGGRGLRSVNRERSL